MHAVHLVVSAAILAANLAAPGAASAADMCKGGPKSQWKGIEQVKAAAAEHGYGKVVKVIIEDGCYEAVTINADGKIVGVQFDPLTLKIEKVEQPR